MGVFVPSRAFFGSLNASTAYPEKRGFSLNAPNNVLIFGVGCVPFGSVCPEALGFIGAEFYNAECSCCRPSNGVKVLKRRGHITREFCNTNKTSQVDCISVHNSHVVHNLVSCWLPSGIPADARALEYDAWRLLHLLTASTTALLTHMRPKYGRGDPKKLESYTFLYTMT